MSPRPIVPATMHETDSPCILLPWDTDFFGFRIGRVQSTHLTTVSVDAILQWVETQQLRCLYFSADPTCAVTLELACWNRFKFVDQRIDFSLKLERPLAGPVGMSPVRPAQASDLPQLEAIARESHRDTRFFKDRAFPTSRAEDLYARWIVRDLEVHQVLVVGDGSPAGRIAGYITCETDRSLQSGRIGLIAVESTAQGRGIGRALIQAGLLHFQETGCRTVKVATQAANINAQRLYQAAGFRSEASALWFHRWFPTDL